MVWPSSRLEGFSTTPNANWDDVGGLRLLKLEFERHIVKRIKFPEVYEDLRVHTPTTFFLFGSFGCGKTLIVKALANEAGANFLHIKGPRLSKYGDQIELVVHIIFNYARAHCPCILFFDELEAIIPGGAEGRLRDFVKLVIELNRDQNLGIYVIVATNRPEVVIHLALPCIEIFDKILHVPLPSPVERGAILKALARNKPIDAHVDLMALGKDVACENFSGADLSALMMEAVKAAIDRQTLLGGGCRVPLTIKYADFNRALEKVYPSVSPMEVKKWEHVPAKCEADLEWE